MQSVPYRGYAITEDDGLWCVSLGILKGRQCFSSLDAAKAAVDERIKEIENETGNK